MHKQIGINRAFCSSLVETFEFTYVQLELLYYQIPMTQEIYNSILDCCMDMGSIADDLFYRFSSKYSE